AAALLVEVVPDARAVRQQMLDRYAIVDQGQVLPEQRTRPRVESEEAVIDQPHHRQSGEALRATRDREAGIERVLAPAAPRRQTERAGERLLAGSVDPDDPGEVPLGRDTDDRLGETIHARRLYRAARPRRLGTAARHSLHARDPGRRTLQV